MMRLTRMYRTYGQIPHNISLWRHLLLMPFVFEVLSTIMQMRDARRRARIDGAGIRDPHLQKVFAYNAGVTKGAFTRTRRTQKCYVELTAPYSRLPYMTSGLTDVQIAGARLEDERLLIIGPRNVHELLLAWLHGYQWKNIYGADLYSTNPRIVPMDMNALAFRSQTFDAVSVYSTLAYSSDIRATLSEICRVLKPNGRLVFDVAHLSARDDDQGGPRLRGEEIRRHLTELGFHITAFRTTYVGDPETKSYSSDYFFTVQKMDPAPMGFDTIEW